MIMLAFSAVCGHRNLDLLMSNGRGGGVGSVGGAVTSSSSFMALATASQRNTTQQKSLKKGEERSFAPI
jgi:hypothetical protein